MILISLTLQRRRYLRGLAACLFCSVVSLAVAQEDAKSSGPALALPADVLDVTWEWVGLQTPKDEITVDTPENYTLTLAADGSVALQVDCNRGMSSYTVGKDNRIAFDPISTTMMMCAEGSLDHDFTSNLERVRSYFQLDGDLLLEQPYDSGTLRFRPASVSPDTAPGQ